VGSHRIVIFLSIIDAQQRILHVDIALRDCGSRPSCLR
jgi:hypothetical protein